MKKTFRNSLAIIILSSAMFLPAVCLCDTIVLKSSLNWRQDATGDYVLPKPVNGEYNQTEFVATVGQIKTICANYASSGKVAVQVSADNGLHYYPVTNGVPLVSDFVSGDRIKWKAKQLDEDAELYALTITYNDSVRTIASFGSPQLSGFSYRKEIFLKNPSKQELFNYQLKLKLGIDKKSEGVDLNCGGKSRLDFSDVRFTCADGETPLPYYLDKQGQPAAGALASGVGVVWVKVPQIPADGVKIYMYYGNPDAADLSNPKGVFDFYDNFKNAALDAKVWDVKPDQKGSCSLKDGQLKLDAAQIISKDFIFKQGIVEYALAIESGFENSLNFGSLIVYSSAYKGAEHCIAIDDIVKINDAKSVPVAVGGKYNYRLTVNNKDITYERLDQAAGEGQAKVTYTAADALKPDHLALKSGGDGSGMNVIAYSYIRVRKLASIEPLVGSLGEEERVNLPVFSNLAISNKGSVILANSLNEGTYITKAIPAGFTARIMVPSFKGTQASLSISADNADNYKTDCLSGNYYYASKDDFTAGINIVAKVKLMPSSDKNSISELEEVKLDYNPGTISVIKPNGKETLAAGTAQDIFWSALGYDTKYPIKLEYSLDNGKSFTLIADKVENSGAYKWSIPGNLSSSAALIRVSDSNDALVNDKSDNVFTIQGLGLTVNIPVEEKKLDEVSKPEKKSLAGMYDLLIKIGDNPSFDGYKDGDIVMIKPAGYLWGSEEKARFLIVRTRLTPKRALELMQPEEMVTLVGKSNSKITKILKKRKYHFNMQDKVTLQDRAKASQGHLIGKILEVGDMAVEIEKK